MGFLGSSADKESICQCIRCRFHLWVRKIPCRGHGNPLQYSCLGNLMDRGAWWATVHRVPKSRTQLKWLSMHVVLNIELSTLLSLLKCLLFLSKWMNECLMRMYIFSSTREKDLSFFIQVDSFHGVAYEMRCPFNPLCTTLTILNKEIILLWIPMLLEIEINI